MSPLSSSLQVSAEPLENDVQIDKGELDDTYSYEIKTVNGIKTSAKVYNVDGSDSSEVIFNQKTGQILLNGEVLSEVDVKELKEFTKLFKHDNKAPKEIKNVKKSDVSTDIGMYYIPIETGGTTWSFVGDYQASINGYAIPSAMLAAILIILPGGNKYAAAVLSAFATLIAGMEAKSTLYWKASTYRRWDTSLSPDQYMYRTGIYFYGNSARTVRLGGFQFDHYGY